MAMASGIKRKGLQDFLMEDSSLTEKISYDEFNERKIAPANSDDRISDVYRVYREVIRKLEARGGSDGSGTV